MEAVAHGKRNEREQCRGRVRAWEELVTIATYPVPEPDRNPMFLEKRVYQQAPILFT